MSKKTHEKQLERARAKRAAERAQQHSSRVRVIAILLVLALAFSVVVAVLASGGGTPDPVVSPSPNVTPTEVATGAFAQPCDLSGAPAPSSTATPYDERPTFDVNSQAVYRVEMETTCGTIVALLDPTVSPTTVEAFLALSRDGYYDGAPFHRVIEGFMIQGGDPTGTGTGNGTFPGYTMAEETDKAQELFDLFGGYPRRALAMAKTAQPNSTGSQFFVVQGRVPSFEPADLPPEYTVFGWAIEGMDVVDRIAAGPYRADNPQLAANPVHIVGVTFTEVERPEGGIYPTNVDDADGPAGDEPSADGATTDPTPTLSP